MSIRSSGVFGCVALLTTVLAASSFGREAADRAVCDSKGKVANLNFTLKDMNGKDVVLSAYKGHVVLLDFWATWCGPCKIEIPGFVDLYTRYGPQGFVVLGVSIDDPIAKLKPFATQFKMNYPVLVGRGRDDLQDAFGPLLGYPTSFLISRDGKICTQHTGLAPKEQFEREIQTLM
jgi:peroxiredoxin